MAKTIETEKDVAKVEETVETSETVENKDSEVASKYSKFANYSENKLRSSSAFNRMAALDLELALDSVTLSTGDNPSAKYLVQEINDQDVVDEYAKIIKKLAPTEEFIGQGKGAEYGLVNGLAVNKLDNTKFIPQGRNDMGNYTFWDTIELSADPSDFDKVEVSIATYLYVQYYLNGELEKLANIIKPKVDQAFVRKQAKALLGLIQLMFRQTMAKASSTEGALTNHKSGTTTLSQIDAMKEMWDFLYGMSFDNVQFNYGIDTYNSGTSSYDHTDFTGAYNSCSEANRVYIAEFQTYNNMKKYATTFLSTAQINDYFNLDKWVILPSSIYNNTSANPWTKGGIEQILTLSTVSDSTVSRVAGAVMVMDTRAMKRVYNLAFNTSEYFASNMTTQVYGFKNWAMKFMKWGQVAVYHNAALESNFVVPTTTVTISK